MVTQPVRAQTQRKHRCKSNRPISHIWVQTKSRSVLKGCRILHTNTECITFFSEECGYLYKEATTLQRLTVVGRCNDRLWDTDFWWRSKWWAIIDGVSMATFIKQIQKTNSSLNGEGQEDTHTWVMWNSSQHRPPQGHLWVLKPVLASFHQRLCAYGHRKAGECFDAQFIPPTNKDSLFSPTESYIKTTWARMQIVWEPNVVVLDYKV